MTLTRHRAGSVRELWSISFPLIVSSFSSWFMTFVDRLFLARYSNEALSASVTAGIIAWAALSATMALAGMIEAFVSQHNGAGREHQIGRCIWQMIWFSFFILLLTVPLGLWGGNLIFSGSLYEEMEITYFKWIMCFCFTYPLITALTAFYSGRGQVGLIIWLALFANIINVTLDAVLIFGIEGWLPSLGVLGAAAATCISQSLQALVLLLLFFTKEYRERYGTTAWTFDPSVFFKCMRIGVPIALLLFAEGSGWGIFYLMMTHLTETHIVISGICQTMMVLFWFFAEATARGGAVIAGNLIGGGQLSFVSRVLKVGVKLHLIFFLIVAVVLVIYPDFWIKYFLGQGEFSIDLPLQGIDGSSSVVQQLIGDTRICFYFLLFYLLFEGVRWLISAILTASGDTAFCLWAGALTMAGLLILPVYLFVVNRGGSVSLAWFWVMIYSMGTCTLYLWRFLSGKWREIRIAS